MNNLFSWEAFLKIPIVGILRNIALAKTDILSRHYLDAGLTTLEITMNSEAAAETISSLNADYGDQLNIGAGTVCTLKDLDKALKAGASFIVTPITDKKIIKECVSNKIPVFAGAYSPTEIYKAWKWGASMVKVFPAGNQGPAYIKEILAPLNDIKLLPTGGITIHNFSDFLKAGAHGLGMGSHLLPKDLIENNQWEALSEHLSGFVKKYNAFKNEN